MRTLRHLALALAWACSLIAGVFVLLYVLPEAQASTSWVAMAAAFIPYGILLWLVALVLFLVAGRRWTRVLAFPALVALVIQLGWARPYWPGVPQPDAPGTPVTVLSANVRLGEADPASLARAIEAADPDVVVVVEASEPFVGSAALAGVLADRPHRVGGAAPGHGPAHPHDASGTVIFSRFALTEVAKVPSAFDQYVVAVGAGPTPLTLVAVHPRNMMSGAAAWEREGAILRDAVRPHLSEPLALVGDFNATPEHLTLRWLLDAGLGLGSQEAGAGWQPTFRAGMAIPTLVAIDHVLTNDRVTTRSYETARIEGSDHLAVVARLVYR